MTTMLRVGRLWLPEAAAPIAAPPVLRGADTASAAATSMTVPLPVTTNAGDCIVLGVASSSGASIVGSGAGATWQTIPVAVPFGPTAIVVGSNCSAGQTTCAVSFTGGFPEISAVCSVWSGIATASPVLATGTGFSPPSALSATTSSVSFAPSQLVAGMACNNGTGTFTESWPGAALPNTLIGSIQFPATVNLSLSCILPTGGGTTTFRQAGTGTGTYSVAAAVLNHL